MKLFILSLLAVLALVTSLETSKTDDNGSLRALKKDKKDKKKKNKGKKGCKSYYSEGLGEIFFPSAFFVPGALPIGENLIFKVDFNGPNNFPIAPSAGTVVATLAGIDPDFTLTFPYTLTLQFEDGSTLTEAGMATGKAIVTVNPETGELDTEVSETIVGGSITGGTGSFLGAYGGATTTCGFEDGNDNCLYEALVCLP
eukprot:CAMPEP_0203690572 /NCGR_PEP_ID=MMETSP0091-20130426/2969_1 /ASSEMBLY_ACC=CAM_ASM_001089 /TAXON_ID=426623 /ORGANISM="Chaetoceros affinis, Strain CCMP159" /LENGTH=198 /DNA_ID=CAMNT_0050560783 /DNA_START=33 /DNA_END=629 /DNA_ORIENTATION=-